MATLFGSGTTNYRSALTLATVATFLGSLTAVLLAGTLFKLFSGKGLVADQFVAEPGYFSVVALGVVIAVGGIVSVRKVAETMSQKITSMSHEQGLLANLMTGTIVIGASRMGLPVSTTHVSCGTLFGIGTVTRQGNAKMIGTIMGAWVITLPLGATLGALSDCGISRLLEPR